MKLTLQAIIRVGYITEGFVAEFEVCQTQKNGRTERETGTWSFEYPPPHFLRKTMPALL